MGGGGSDHKIWECTVGLPWSEEEFFEKAIKQRHPLEDQPEVPDRTKEAIFTMLTEGPKAWVKATQEKLDKIKKLRDDLEGDEKAMKERLPEKVYKINQNNKK